MHLPPPSLITDLNPGEVQRALALEAFRSRAFGGCPSSDLCLEDQAAVHSAVFGHQRILPYWFLPPDGDDLHFLRGDRTWAVPVQLLGVWTPNAMVPPVSSHPDKNFKGSHVVCEVDDGELVYITSVMPPEYAGGGVDVKVSFAHGSTTGTMTWESSFEKIGDDHQVLTSDGFATGQTVAKTVSSTANQPVTATISHTDGAQMDSVAAGDPFRLRIKRTTGATGIAFLVLVWMIQS